MENTSVQFTAKQRETLLQFIQDNIDCGDTGEERHTLDSIIDLLEGVKHESDGRKRRVVEGEFNHLDTEVVLVREGDGWELETYPDLMNWTDAMELLEKAGYHENDNGLLEELSDEVEE